MASTSVRSCVVALLLICVTYVHGQDWVQNCPSRGDLSCSCLSSTVLVIFFILPPKVLRGVVRPPLRLPSFLTSHISK